MSVDKELSEYMAKTARSRVLHEEALAVMPGGNSRTTTSSIRTRLRSSGARAPTSGTPTGPPGWTSTATTRA